MPVRPPTVILMHDTGTSTVYTGDESDRSRSRVFGGIAKGANILFVYTGNNPNFGVFDAAGIYDHQQTGTDHQRQLWQLQEWGYGQTSYRFNNFLSQAAVQGQTVIASAGDAGSVDCYADTGLSTTTQVSLPIDAAGSQYVTGMGGTEYLAADVAVGNTQYWQAKGTSDILTSAKSYIPEQVWNDIRLPAVSSGGGGAVFFLRSQLADRGSGHYRRQLPSGAGYLAGILAEQWWVSVLHKRLAEYRNLGSCSNWLNATNTAIRN